MAYTIGTKRASELFGVTTATIRGMIEHPEDVGFKLGFKIPSSKKNPERKNYRVYANVVAEQLHISIDEVIE